MPTYQIRPLSDDAQAQACAAFMAQSDPWLTLGVDYPSLLRTVLGALERREIGVVAWRCGRADDTGRDAENLQVAAAVLGVFGFQHFALADGEHGVELVPAEVMASNEMIFSIEPSFLARFAA